MLIFYQLKMIHLKNQYFDDLIKLVVNWIELNWIELNWIELNWKCWKFEKYQYIICLNLHLAKRISDKEDLVSNVVWSEMIPMTKLQQNL